MLTTERLPSSFRDPSGFVFRLGTSLFRQVAPGYKEHYDQLIASGLYQTLSDCELLVKHQEVDLGRSCPEQTYKVLKPELVPFISYPYEWCFDQLKDAALCTLKVQKLAMQHGMTLKDASAFNIQFLKGKAVLIDTLSFEMQKEGEPWVAYRQFCQHFLAPLALMSYKDIRLNRMLQLYIDGIPLDLATSLLPNHAWLNISLLAHLLLHSRSQRHYSDKQVEHRRLKLSALSLAGLIDNLEATISSLKCPVQKTEWADYYADTNYSDAALSQKERLVSEFLDELAPAKVWDIGANVGLFSRIAAKKGMHTVSMDVDPMCVERNYRVSAERGETNILPLVLDLTAPTPAIGWGAKERLSLSERGPADTVMALALIHHLAISNNVPLWRIAEFFAEISKSLIIEFVPRDDCQVERLLLTREDIFPNYTQEAFEAEFGKFFDIEKSVRIDGSRRTLYLMKR